MADLLHLASGAWELEVQAARGGCVTALRHRGRAVLVSPNPSTEDAMGSASFVLAPYANRIAQGCFEHAGRAWVLPRNFGDHAHPLHGIGWKRAWSVVGQQAEAIELRLQHAADAHWPWAFEATQRISLAADAARFELSVTNQASESAPVGVGFHPAFAACPATTLSSQWKEVWTIDADSLPVSLVPAGVVLPELPGAVPGSGAGTVSALRETLVDHCFTGWPGELVIANAGSAGDLDITLAASPELPFLQLYLPPGRNWFCAEPMSQMPDAVNRAALPGAGLRVLAPGESLRVWMEIGVSRAA